MHSQYTHRGRAWGTSRRNTRPKTHLRRNPTPRSAMATRAHTARVRLDGPSLTQHTCPRAQQPLLPGWPQVLTRLGDTDAFRGFQGSVSGTARVHCFCVASHL